MLSRSRLVKHAIYESMMDDQMCRMNAKMCCHFKRGQLYTHTTHRSSLNSSYSPSTPHQYSICGKTRGGYQCIFDYFWLFWGVNENLGVERYQWWLNPLPQPSDKSSTAFRCNDSFMGRVIVYLQWGIFIITTYSLVYQYYFQDIYTSHNWSK